MRINQQSDLISVSPVIDLSLSSCIHPRWKWERTQFHYSYSSVLELLVLVVKSTLWGVYITLIFPTWSALHSVTLTQRNMHFLGVWLSEIKCFVRRHHIARTNLVTANMDRNCFFQDGRCYRFVTLTQLNEGNAPALVDAYITFIFPTWSTLHSITL